MKDPLLWWPAFWELASILEDMLGPILFQFPPRFSATSENISRLHELELILPRGQHFAFEFRNSTWKREDIADLFERNEWTSVVVHVSNRPAPWSRRTTSWTQLKDGWTDMKLPGKCQYIRLHGTEGQYSGVYQGTLAGSELLDMVLDRTQLNLPTYVAYNNTDSFERMTDGRTLPSAIADATSMESIFGSQRCRSVELVQKLPDFSCG